jgi:H+-transporting ATPase
MESYTDSLSPLGVPIAMPIVLSVTMAIGAGHLATKQCIVKHFTAIEELAGMDILCSDKTGTLTKNKLEVYDAIVYDDRWSKEEILFQASLATTAEGQDAIDAALLAHLDEKQLSKMKARDFNSYS